MSRSHWYWLPLLSLHSGARLGELCQLYADDVREKQGVHYLYLTNEGEDQSIKGRGDEVRKRRTPIHREIIRLGFLDFVKRNLSGRTRLRSDPAFASQSGLVQSLSEVVVPDMVIRSGQMPLALEQLCRQVGLDEVPIPPTEALPGRDALAGFYDDEVEAAARAVYNRDFTAFGFRRWRG